MHIILGAGGTIGIELAKALEGNSHKVRLVARTPKKVTPSNELFKADLLKEREVLEATAGATVVYLTVGLPYVTEVWQRDWPRVMEHTITACKAHQAKLVFVDNVYMYGRVEGKMTEQTPFNPNSKKGEVRAVIARRLLDEIKRGTLQGLIARAPDFYGVNVTTSILESTVIEPLKKGKAAQWLCNADVKHNFIFTPDAGKAIARLGTSDEAFGETWHLPTAEAITGRALIARVAEGFGREPKVMVLSPLMIKMIGLFVPVLREFGEMLYQYDSDYDFSSERIERVFGITPTSYEEGISAIVRAKQ